MWLIAMMTATYTMQSVVRVLLSIYIVWLGFFSFSACVFQLPTRVINLRLHVWQSADWQIRIMILDESRDHVTRVVQFTVSRIS